MPFLQHKQYTEEINKIVAINQPNYPYPNVPKRAKTLGPSENVISHIYDQRRFKSAYASAQSDQIPRSSHEETLHPWLSKACLVFYQKFR